MSTAMVVAEAMENEAIVFGLFGIAVIGLCLWFGYVLRRWSWIPRRQQRRGFGERF